MKFPPGPHGINWPPPYSEDTMTPNRAWRAMWFMDDDDRTPQGKLARGCFYLIYMFLFCFGVVTPIVIALFWSQP